MRRGGERGGVRGRGGGGGGEGGVEGERGGEVGVREVGGGVYKGIGWAGGGKRVGGRDADLASEERWQPTG